MTTNTPTTTSDKIIVKSINNPEFLTNFMEREYNNLYLDMCGEEVCCGEGLQLPANDHKWNGGFSIQSGLKLNLSYRIQGNETFSSNVDSFTLDLANHRLYWNFEVSENPLDKWDIDFEDACDYDERWEEFDKWYCEELVKRWSYGYGGSFGDPGGREMITLKTANLSFSTKPLEEGAAYLHTTNPDQCFDSEWKDLMSYLVYSAEQGLKHQRHEEFGKKDEHYDKSVKVIKRIEELKQVGLTEEQIQPILKSEGLVATKTGGGAKGKPRGKDGCFAYNKKKPREFNNQKCPNLSDTKRTEIENSIKKGYIINFGKLTEGASKGFMVCERDCKAGDKAIRGLCLYWNGKVNYRGKWVRVYLEQVKKVSSKAGFVITQEEQEDKGRKLFEAWNKTLVEEDDFKDNLFIVPEEEKLELPSAEELPTTKKTEKEVEKPKKKPRGRPKKVKEVEKKKEEKEEEW